MRYGRVFGAGVVFVLLLVFLVCCGADAAVFPGEGDVRGLCVARGGVYPEAADFLSVEAKKRCEEQGIAVTFEGEVDFDALGEKNVTLNVGGERVEAVNRIVLEVTLDGHILPLYIPINLLS